MNKNPKQQPGTLLIHLMQNGLKDIMRRESGNETGIHLYNTGDYWVAFEKSAYQLHLLFPQCVLWPMRCTDYPSPLMMASLDDEDLRRCLHSCPVTFDSLRYKVVSSSRLSTRSYNDWHEKETNLLKGF